METEFNEEYLEEALKDLSHEHKVLFMLSCCERLYPNYIAFHKKYEWGNPTILRGALDFVWALFEGKTKDEDKIMTLLQQCDAVVPDTENFDSVFVSFALDSAVAVTLLFEFLLTGLVEKIIEVASLARDTVDMYIQEIECMAPDDSNLEEIILEHRLMQQELRRQRKDIKFLKDTALSDKAKYDELKKKWFRVKISNIELK